MDPGSLDVGAHLKTLNMPLTCSGIGFQWRGRGGSLTKSYYAGQDVLIVLWRGRQCAQSQRETLRFECFKPGKCKKKKSSAKVNKPDRPTSSSALLQVSALLGFKICFVTNEQHAVYKNIPTALRPQPQYDLWTVASAEI